jgi:zinc D-Ala-D-Ala carboxypeptidase
MSSTNTGSLRRDEFKCSCCGGLVLDDTFFEMLCKARETAATPFVVNSGYRCAKHNAEVGSTSKNHTSGRAADIKAVYGPERGKILKGLYLAGFKRVGVGKTFIHADNMAEVESCWLY